MNEERRQTYLNFLLHLIPAFLTGNPQVVYSYLEDNLDKLDDGMVELFQSWTGVYSFIRSNFYKLRISLPMVSPDKAEVFVARMIANLCDTLVQFDGEGKASNIEIAIAGHKMILNVFDRKTFSEEWAKTQISLGAAYRNRIQGDQAENLELSIECYRNTLSIYTPDADTDADKIRWADIQNNLANTYRDLANIYRNRIHTNPEVNLERAIACCCNALYVYFRFSRWETWSGTQNNLALIYKDRIWGNPADNLEKAIDCCYNALKFYTHGAFSVTEHHRWQWATIQNNLSMMFRNRSYGEKPKNLEQALAFCKNTLQVRTRKDFPSDWADTQNNLGLIHRDLGQIDEAISCFQLALEIFKPNTFPLKCLMSGGNLGNTAFADQRWAKAIEGYDVAIQAVEQSRIWSSNDTRRKEITSEAMEVYVKAVQACINDGKPDKSLEYVERNKVRNLVELLANKDLYPKRELYTHEEDYQRICNQLDQLRREIPAQQRQLEIMVSGQAPEPSNPFHVEKLQQNLNHLQKQQDSLLREINQVDSSFKFTQQVEPISFRGIQSLIDERTTIIEWYLMGDRFCTFIITRHSPYPKVLQFSAKDIKLLGKRTKAYLRLYDRKNSSWWRNQLEERLENLAEILHINEILSHIPKECDQLIIIPHQGLHILPLHALPLGKKEQTGKQITQNYLLDQFPRGVRYAPSCQLLQLSQNRQNPSFSNLFAIQNPTDDLPYTNLEVELICTLFPSVQVLAKQEATETALKVNQELPLANCIHFSCHGKFNLKSPLESALILAKDEQPEDGRLTLAEIFGLTLNQCCLVTLSACETGLTGLNDISDEYISLPSGFLYAGSPSVVSSLWSVNDLSTALLMIKFYQNLKSGSTVALALNTAQTWLRDATKEQLEQWAKQLPNPTHRMQVRAFLSKQPPKTKPFESPYYWAAFCAIGQ